MPAGTPPASRIDEALSTGELLSVDVGEVNEYYTASCDGHVVAISEAPVPLSENEESRFVLFRESHKVLARSTAGTPAFSVFHGGPFWKLEV